ncbi:MAG: translation initiation factor [Marinilabiliales bacterium]|nr:MAG: translation initiation factor [Marinilabiliales bacterium]
MSNKNKKFSDLSSLGGLVYSTNSDAMKDLENKANDEEYTPDPSEQTLRVWIEKKHRGGKTVTIVRDFEGSDQELADLAKTLKNKCGTGGSAKDGEIILQGSIADKVVALLKDMGYNVKRAGG